MLIKKPSFYFILICYLFLLSGLFSSMIHATEHPFHDETETCQVYYFLEQNENSVLFHASHHIINKPINYFIVLRQYLLISKETQNYPIRASPKTI